MSDLTPDTLAALAYRLECNGEAAAAIVCLHHASSWRANLAFANEDNTSMNSRLVDAEARIEAANKTWVGMWQEEHDQCIEALARIEALEKVLRRGRWVHGYMGAEGEVAFLTNAEQLNECEDLVAEDTDVGGFLRWEVEPLTRAEYRATLRSEEE